MWRAPHYRTRDHVIPFGVFWIHMEGILANWAAERLNLTRAVNTAITMSFRSASEPEPKSLKQDQRDAYVAE